MSKPKTDLPMPPRARARPSRLRLWLQRWLPVAALAATAAGMALHIAGLPYGQDLVVVAVVVAAALLFIRPLRLPSLSNPFDEREQMLDMRATNVATRAVAASALLGALLFSADRWVSVWTPRTAQDWWMIALTLWVLLGCAYALHIGWAVRPLDGDEDETF